MALYTSQLVVILYPTPNLNCISQKLYDASLNHCSLALDGRAAGVNTGTGM